MAVSRETLIKWRTIQWFWKFMGMSNPPKDWELYHKGTFLADDSTRCRCL